MSEYTPIKCPNCKGTNTVYSIPDWEHDSERGNYCSDPGYLECLDCHFNTGYKNTEAEIMAAISTPASSQDAERVDKILKEYDEDFGKVMKYILDNIGSISHEEAAQMILARRKKTRDDLLALCTGRELVNNKNLIGAIWNAKDNEFICQQCGMKHDLGNYRVVKEDR